MWCHHRAMLLFKLQIREISAKLAYDCLEGRHPPYIEI